MDLIKVLSTIVLHELLYKLHCPIIMLTLNVKGYKQQRYKALLNQFCIESPSTFDPLFQSQGHYKVIYNNYYTCSYNS